MTKHIINKDDFKGQKVEHKIAFSVGDGSNKHLIVVVELDTNCVHYEIIDHDTKVIAYTLENAIELYNKL